MKSLYWKDTAGNLFPVVECTLSKHGSIKYGTVVNGGYKEVRDAFCHRHLGEFVYQ